MITKKLWKGYGKDMNLYGIDMGIDMGCGN
jgi:hypothetical protein